MSEASQRSQSLAQQFKNACLAELETLKPGNVHVFADGHGMVVADFINSAEAAAAVIARPGQRVGQRVLAAAEATWQSVGCNTNLGILLLCAPLLHAAQERSDLPLRDALCQLLQDLNVEDAEAAYRAIRIAQPAGLGQSAQHDVQQPPHVSLLEAMRTAEARDRIAWQYTHGFEDIFAFGLPRYQEMRQRWGWSAWAASAVHLGFMSRFADSHIARKHGLAVAEQVRQQAAQYEQSLLAQRNPRQALAELLAFDSDLKARRLNPGTSADLTVATLLAAALLPQAPPLPAGAGDVRPG